MGWLLECLSIFCLIFCWIGLIGVVGLFVVNIVVFVFCRFLREVGFLIVNVIFVFILCWINWFVFDMLNGNLGVIWMGMLLEESKVCFLFVFIMFSLLIIKFLVWVRNCWLFFLIMKKWFLFLLVSVRLVFMFVCFNEFNEKFVFVWVIVILLFILFKDFELVKFLFLMIVLVGCVEWIVNWCLNLVVLVFVMLLDKMFIWLLKVWVFDVEMYNLIIFYWF